jgi:hypothetical protein
MSNERRVRANFVLGTLTSAIITTDTTLAGAAFANLPVIDANSHAAISLIDTTNGLYEIATVTAHTASSTTVTVLRAQESTTAQSWAAGSTFVAAPTTRDFPTGVDYPWGGDTLSGGPFDAEFDRAGLNTSLPSGWSWVGQGSATYEEQYGWGSIVTPGYASGTGYQHWMVVRSLPSAATWTATAKIAGTFPKSGTATAASNPTLLLRESASSKFVTLEPRAHTPAMYVITYTGPTAGAAVLSSGAWVATLAPQYLRFARTATSTYVLSASMSGSTFTPVYTWTSSFTPDQIGFGAAQEIGPLVAGVAHCDWLRIR